MGYPLFAVLVVHIGNDNSFSHLLTLPSYYSDLLIALLCSYGVGLYLKKLYIALDRRFDWYSRFSQRLKYQFFLGWLVPVVFVMLVEIVYLSIIGIPLGDSSIFYLELPVVGLMALLINFSYLFLYHQAHIAALKRKEQAGIDKNYSTHFAVKIGLTTRNIPLEEVAYFLIEDKVTFLVSTKNKKYIYDFSLDQIRQEVPPDEFFHLNRQAIASRKSIVACKKTETRRLAITLDPPLSTPLYVAKTKATALLAWLSDR